MKKILTVLLLILTISSYSQTKLDMLTFNALNEYRIERGVEPLIFDSNVWKAAQHHSTYLFTDRLRYYGVKWSGTAVECVTSWGGDNNDVENAIRVINQWDSSPSHKEGMLEKDVTRMAISIVEVRFNCDMSYNYKGKVVTNKFTCVKYFATFLVVE